MKRFSFKKGSLLVIFSAIALELLSQQFIEQTSISLTPVGDHSSVVWGDYDRDGDLDILLTGNGNSKIYRNDGSSVFTEQTSITLQGVWNGSAAWGDYDNDGDLDILIAGYDASRIYRNSGGPGYTFTEQTSISLIGTQSGSATWADYDNDGDLDILLTGSGFTKIYKNNGDNTFTDQTSFSLPGLEWSSAAWGDYDNDGYVDILLTGSVVNNGVSKIYRNNRNGTFSEQTGIVLQPVSSGSAIWGDYDNDGDIDILLSGYNLTKIYKNNSNNTFTEQTGITLVGLSNPALTWADYDNDGDLDILMAGSNYNNGTNRYAKIYKNSGSSGYTYTEQTDIVLPGLENGSAAWGDYNKDGKLDFLLTGYTGSGYISKVYLNNTGTANSAPAAPSGLVNTVNDSLITLSWNKVTTDITPSNAMSYNVRVGTSPGASDVAAPMISGTSTRLIPGTGNTYSNNFFIIRKPKKATYYWSVQAIDNGFASGVFATESSITFSTSVQASQLYASNTQGSSLTLNWTRGNGTGVVLFAKKANSGTAAPVNNTTYTANPVFGSGSQIGSTGWYCVYNGTSSNVNITGLETLTDYIFQAFEYDAGPVYNTAIAQLNPFVTQTGAFSEQTAIALQGVAWGSVVWGDYDNDADPDILVTGNGYSKIFRNDGSNVFTEQTGIILSGVSNSSSAWGDYDNDGDLDIIITGYYTSQSSIIYRNNGNNTFTEQTGIILMGVNQGSVAWGDYDNDGFLDILITGYDATYMTVSRIYHNNGNSTFTEQSGIILPGVGNGSVAWGDYDNDNDLDILISGYNNPSGYISKIYRNNGDNTFTEQTDISLQSVDGSSVAWGDYDNDGDLDILLTGSGQSKIYRNNGNNTFSEQTGIVLQGIRYGSVAWGDYDNDGYQDILLTGSGFAKIYRNNGNGTFTEKPYLNQQGVLYSSAAWGDYDKDGKLDIMLSGQSTSGNVTKIFRNFSVSANAAPSAPTALTATTDATSITLGWTKVTGDATPAAGMSYNVRIGTSPGTNNIVSSMARADGSRLVTGLGNAQLNSLFVLKSPKKQTYYFSVQAIDNGLASGPFAAEKSVTYSVSVQASNVFADSIKATGIKLRWNRGNASACVVFARKGASGTAVPANGTSYTANPLFGSGTQIGTSGWYCIYKGTGTEVNVTGLEPFTNYAFQAIEFDASPAYYTGTGQNNPLYTQTGLFTAQTSISLPGVSYSNAAWGDYNNDGYSDLLITGYSNTTYTPISKIFKNNGNNTFSEQISIVLPGVQNSFLAWRDYDNDNDLDFLLAGQSSGGYITKIFRNDGSNTFSEQPGITLPAFIYGVFAAWGDYDNDGDQDLLLTGGTNTGYTSKIYRNNGDNTFTEQTGISLFGVAFGSSAWGDYDNDGDLDVLLTGGGNSRIYRNNGNNTFAEQTGITLTGVTNSSVAWGDYDNDSYLDILITGDNNNNIPVSKVYRNNRNNSFIEQTGIVLPGIAYGSASWGDFDNDGYSDIILSGTTNNSVSGVISKFYRNNGDNTFTERANPSEGVIYGILACADYDKDGKLDFIVSGQSASAVITKIYRNFAITSNIAPQAPAILPEVSNETSIVFRWTRPTGDATPSKGLGYNIRVGTTPGGTNLVTPMALANGSRLVPHSGNAQSDTLFILKNPKKLTYYWSVQAIDNGLAASAFTAEKSITYSVFVQASKVIASTVNGSGININWTRGNGAGCVVFVRKTNTGTATPVNGTTYTANAAFGSGTQIGTTGWFCVYNGTGNSVSITALEALTTYTFHVLEFDAGPVYDSRTAPVNPLIAKTGLFDEQTAITLQAVTQGSSAWGDYDGDGDFDILLTGSNTSKIYKNNGNNTFTEQTTITLQGVSTSSVAWGDYDNDNDLDILLTGSDVSKIYRNEGVAGFSDQTTIVLPGLSYGSVAWGDYNNDGLKDILLTGTSGGAAISKIFKNNGNNTFSEQTAISLQGVSQGSAAWGDYDNDSDLDILLTGYGISKIYRNNGNNTFTDQTNIVLQGISVGSALWGDYDNDADLDIFLSGGGISKVYRNNGNGSFADQTGIVLPGVQNSSSLWVDFDNDGYLDLIITGSTDGSAAGTISRLYRNNQNNTFTEQTSVILPGVQFSSLDAGDYDNDGKPDLLLTGQGNTNISKIYRNVGVTTNTAPGVPAGLLSSPNDTTVVLSWTRVTGDATPAKGISYNVRIGTTPGGSEIVSPMSLSSGKRLLPRMGNAQADSIFILQFPKKGTYYWSVQAVDNGYAGGVFAGEQSFSFSSAVQASQLFASNIQGTSLTVNWTRGNGSGSVVFAKSGNSGIAVPVNNTTYTANPQVGSGTQIGTTGWFCVYNGTGNNVNVTGLSSLSNYIFQVFEFDAGPAYYTNAGQNNPAVFQTVLFGEQTGISLQAASQGSTAWGDYDNDGDLDILLTGSGSSRIYKNNGNNTFSLLTSLVGISYGNAAWGDFDNDGDLDILQVGNNASRIYRNNGNSTFTEQFNGSLHGISQGSAAWGDYNNDGYLDILISGRSGTLGTGVTKIYRNNGSAGGFTEQTGINLTGVMNCSVAWGDYDNDGDLDILLTGTTASAPPGSITSTAVVGSISKVYRNNGDDTFSEQTGISLQAVSSGSVAWGDYDNDGDLDILLTGATITSNSFATKIYRNNGSNSFSELSGVSIPGVAGSSAAWGDHDNDGDLDILIAGRITGGSFISRLYNNVNNTFTEQTGLTIPPVYLGSVSWADYDNDSRLDFLITGQSSESTISKIYRNFSSTSNIAPTAPTGLVASGTATSLILKWDRVAGDATPAKGINYNVRIGSATGAIDVVSPMSLTAGTRMIPILGNIQADTFLILQFPKKQIYYWSVQAIDHGFKASPFATEQSFNFTTLVQANQVTSDNIQGSSINLNWRRGNGSACAVFALKGSSGTAVPVDATTYTALPKFGLGTQIGTSGWYCVYNGTGTTVNVTGLDPLTNYTFQVIEYDAGPAYYTQTGQANPFTAQTAIFSDQTGISLPGIQYGSAVWGDYDNDGDLDILLSGNSTSIVTKIYRNNGDNTFTEQTGIILPGVFNSSAAWGDYDNDGDLDILLNGTTNGGGSGAISKIYRNNGNNTFSERAMIAMTGIHSGSAAWGDYDNDGDLDILSTGLAGQVTSTATSKIYRNVNDSTFIEQTGIILQGVSGGSATWGDYDNDGYLDILMSGTNTSKVYRNNGNNNFLEQSGISLLAVSNGSTAWGDYDNDGDLDILLTGTSGTTAISKIYMNNGDNTFSLQSNITLSGSNSGSAIWGDYDNDGYLDIILTGLATDFIRFYRNNKNNTFTEQSNYGLPNASFSSISFGDYSNDGNPDLLVTGISKSGVRIAKVYRNLSLTVNNAPAIPSGLVSERNDSSIVFRWNSVSGDATPSAGITYNIRIGTSPGANNIVSSMSMSSGSLLLPKMGNGQSGTTYVLRYPKKGDYYWSVQAVDQGYSAGAFAPEQTINFSSSLQASQVSSANIQTSSLDLSWQRGNGTSCTVFARKGSGGTPAPVNGTIYIADKQYGAGSQIGTSGWYCIYNGPGSSVKVTGLEAMTFYTFYVIESEPGPVYFTRKGQANPLITQTGLFSEQVDIVLPSLTQGSLSWGDYDNDGFKDILFAGSGSTKIYRNNGNNTFTVQSGIIFPSMFQSSAAWGDYDNDGYLDIIMSGNYITRIYHNNGNNTFSELTGTAFPELTLGSVAWGDYDRDGFIDILLTGQSANGEYVSKIYRNNGSSSVRFAEETDIILQPVNYSSATWGDYDNDGYLDILLTGNSYSGSISKIYRNNRNNGFIEQTSISLAEAGFSSTAWADYDNDGDLDILVTGNGISKVYRNKGPAGVGFEEQTGILLQGVSYGSVAWADFDNDGYSDIVITGSTNGLATGAITKFYRNNSDNTFIEQTGISITGVYQGSIAACDYDNDGKLDIIITGVKLAAAGVTPGAKLYRSFSALSNSNPVAPAGLLASLNDSSVIFRWNRVKGDVTPSKGIGYNIRIGTSPGANNIVSSMALLSGTSLSPGLGNTQSDTMFVLRYPAKATYYWTVQAIDNGYGSGPFATEQSFTYSSAIQASLVNASKIEGTSLNLNWKRGNGVSCIVFAKKGNGGFAAPVNGTAYSANSEFGKGSQIGTTGWYCIYNGTGNNVAVTGLEGAAGYVFQVIEFEGGPGYFTNEGQGNPLVITTSIFTEQTGIVMMGVSQGSMAWGDYDNDGDLDALVTGIEGTFTGFLYSKIYRNNGNNTFTEQTSISLPGVIGSSVAWGDYDNDNYLDILLSGFTANNSTNPVSKVYRNNHNNTFTEKTSISLPGVGNSSIAWGDYDNDGFQDILLTGRLVTNEYYSGIYRNNGDNTFTEQTAIPLTGVYFGSSAWGDYNNDGNLDILLTGVSNSGVSVSILYRNNGDNTFTEQINTILAGVAYGSVSWVDYDNDGDLDILLSGRTGIIGFEVVTKIYRNNGDNTFTDIPDLNITGVAYSSLSWGDYDNDGDPDILLIGRFGNFNVDLIAKIYRNDGNDKFTEQTGIVLPGVDDSSGAWGDYDKDGKLDFLMTGYSYTFGDVTRIYKNNTLSSNSAPVAPTGLVATSDATSLIIKWNRVPGDLTPAKGMNYNIRIGFSSGAGNVVSPMALSNGARLLPRMGNTQSDTLFVLKSPKRATYYFSVQAIDNGFGSGAFSSEQSFNFSTPIQASQVFADSILVSGVNLYWKRGNGSACVVFAKKGTTGTATPANLTNYTASSQFGSGSQIGTTGWYCVYNGTGNKVVLTGLEIMTNYTFHVIEYDAVPNPLYFTQSGIANPASAQTNLFAEQTNIGLTGVTFGSVSWGDYDNDGLQDLLVTGTTTGSNTGATSKIYRNNGSNNFIEQGGPNLPGVMYSSAAWGDYDNDGDLDILLTGTNVSNESISKIYRNDGSSIFTEQTGIVLSGVKESSVAWSDFDNDGDLDILLTGISVSGETAKIYRNNGNGTFTDQQGINLKRITNGSVACADYDNDGFSDILLTGLGVSKIYRNNGNPVTMGFTEQKSISLTGISKGSVAWGDYDSDGDLDILLAGYDINNITPVTKIYKNNGNNSFTWQENIILPGIAGSALTTTTTSIPGSCSAIWGDYDNDGDLDILLAGDTNSGRICKIFTNNGNNSFNEQTNFGLPGVRYSSAAWGDYDNDGDLDIAITGEKGSLRISKVFRNEISTPNTKPATPQGLQMVNNSGSTILSWDAVTDTETPSKGLTYNVRVGSGAGGTQIMVPMSASSGVRRITGMGNTQLKTSYTLKDLKPGTYYWSVQALDNTFAGGSFGLERSFSVDSIQASRLEGKLIRTDNSALALRWKNGNGERRLVFCKQGSSGTALPSNNTTYTADPVFGSGDQIGSTGWYCIYSGRDDSTTVVGLSQGIAYSFQVFEYIGDTGSELFYRTTGVANPGIFSSGLFSDQTDLGLTGVYNSSVSWGDYDNDGDLDIILTGVSTAPVSKIFRNNGNNTFTDQTGINLIGVQNSTATFGDYDNDGDLDLLLTGTATGAFPVSKIYRNNGSNNFTEQLSISLTGVNFSSAAWGDYDNDGDIDILVTGQGAGSTYVAKIYTNNGNGTFSEQTDISLVKISRGSVSWIDYDNDGDLDIFLTGNSALGSQASVLKIYQNKGGKTFTEQSSLNITAVFNSAVAWGDYDNDGDMDLLLTGYYNDGSIRYVSRIYRNNGDYTFALQSGITLDGVANSSVSWGDFDNDGDLDILLTGRLLSGAPVSKIYGNNDNNTFTEVTDISLTGVGYSSAKWGDYDNDGDLDILISGQVSGATAITKIYRNNYLMRAGNYPANMKTKAPIGLKAIPVPEGMKLTWSPIRSDETPGISMEYNLVIKTLLGGIIVSPSQSDTTSGYRHIVASGNAMLDTSFIVKNLTPGKYRWKVQGVDQGYKGGEWSVWNTFEAKNIRAFFSADTVCEGLETHFVNNSTSIGEPITGYSWNFGDGSTSTLPNPSYVFKTSGVHNVQLAVSSASNSDTLIQQVFVYPSPKNSFSSTIACQGVETKFENLTPTSGISITSWSWDFGDGKGSIQQNPGSHGYLSAGDYTASLVAITSDGCSDTVKHTVKVGAIPVAVINASSPSLSFCSGDSISLSVAYNSGYTYQWMSGGLDLAGQDSSKYVAKATGTYSVEVINLTGNCPNTSSDAIVSVRPNPLKPVISSLNYADNQCPPTDTKVKLLLTPELAGYTYQWIKNGIPQTNGNQPSIEGYLEQGDYTVESYLNECKSVSDNFNIKYKAAPDKPVILVKGPKVWYMATSKNTYKYYRWYFENKLIPGADKYLYVANKTLGTYFVEVADDQCFTRSDPKTIPTVNKGISMDDFPAEYLISNDQDELEKLNIYPNPTTGPIQFEMDNKLIGDITITILTLDGKEIRKQKVRKDFEYLLDKIDLTEYSRGKYLIKFELNNSIVIKNIILE